MKMPQKFIIRNIKGGIVSPYFYSGLFIYSLAGFKQGWFQIALFIVGTLLLGAGTYFSHLFIKNKESDKLRSEDFEKFVRKLK